MGFCFAQDQQAELDIYIASSLKQQSTHRHHPTQRVGLEQNRSPSSSVCLSVDCCLRELAYKHPTHPFALEQNRSPSSSVCPSVDCCLSELAI
jgi:hypothetical protein